MVKAIDLLRKISQDSSLSYIGLVKVHLVTIISTHVDLVDLDVCGVAGSFLSLQAPLATLKVKAILTEAHMTSPSVPVRHKCLIYIPCNAGIPQGITHKGFPV